MLNKGEVILDTESEPDDSMENDLLPTVHLQTLVEVGNIKDVLTY
jgi:hypothetical protein